MNYIQIYEEAFERTNSYTAAARAVADAFEAEEEGGRPGLVVNESFSCI